MPFFTDLIQVIAISQPIVNGMTIEFGKMGRVNRSHRDDDAFGCMREHPLDYPTHRLPIHDANG